MGIPQVVKNFLNSEKGVIALALLIGATVLAAMNKMTIAEWQSYSIWVFGIYTGGKSIQGAAAHFAGKAAGAPAAETSADAAGEDEDEDEDGDAGK